jgi:hypothetical protein
MKRKVLSMALAFFLAASIASLSACGKLGSVDAPTGKTTDAPAISATPAETPQMPTDSQDPQDPQDPQDLEEPSPRIVNLGWEHNLLKPTSLKNGEVVFASSFEELLEDPSYADALFAVKIRVYLQGDERNPEDELSRLANLGYELTLEKYDTKEHYYFGMFEHEMYGLIPWADLKSFPASEKCAYEILWDTRGQDPQTTPVPKPRIINRGSEIYGMTANIPQPGEVKFDGGFRELLNDPEYADALFEVAIIAIPYSGNQLVDGNLQEELSRLLALGYELSADNRGIAFPNNFVALGPLYGLVPWEKLANFAASPKFGYEIVWDTRGMTE